MNGIALGEKKPILRKEGNTTYYSNKNNTF